MVIAHRRAGSGRGPAGSEFRQSVLVQARALHHTHVEKNRARGPAVFGKTFFFSPSSSAGFSTLFRDLFVRPFGCFFLEARKSGNKHHRSRLFLTEPPLTSLLELAVVFAGEILFHLGRFYRMLEHVVTAIDSRRGEGFGSADTC